MWIAVRSGSTVRVSSSRGTSTRSCLSCPAAPARTRLKWRTLWSASTMRLMPGSSAGAMPVAPRSAWTSINHQHVAASAQHFPATHLLSHHSTVVTAIVGSWSHGGKAQARLTWSALSSHLSCTSKWTCCLGSCARETGVASTRCGHPIMDWAAQRTPMKMCSWMNWKRPGSTEGPQPKLPLHSESKGLILIWEETAYLKSHEILHLNHASCINHALTQRKCTFVIGRFVGFRNDGEVWLSQVRIWHSVLISGSTELNWIARMEKNAVFSHRLPTCSTSGMTSSSLSLYSVHSPGCV